MIDRSEQLEHILAIRLHGQRIDWLVASHAGDGDDTIVRLAAGRGYSNAIGLEAGRPPRRIHIQHGAQADSRDHTLVGAGIKAQLAVRGFRGENAVDQIFGNSLGARAPGRGNIIVDGDSEGARRGVTIGVADREAEAQVDIVFGGERRGRSAHQRRKWVILATFDGLGRACIAVVELGQQLELVTASAIVGERDAEDVGLAFALADRGGDDRATGGKAEIERLLAGSQVTEGFDEGVEIGLREEDGAAGRILDEAAIGIEAVGSIAIVCAPADVEIADIDRLIATLAVIATDIVSSGLVADAGRKAVLVDNAVDRRADFGAVVF